MHSDPIADMLTRIRNAQAVGLSEVLVPYSKFKHQLAQLFKQEGWLDKVEIDAKHKISKRLPHRQQLTSRHDQLKIKLKYTAAGEPRIVSLKRVSKPGRRVYVSKSDLPIVRSNFGQAVISTSHGLFTNQQAREQGLGGEVVCEIY
jgi:small subunit ribosomal protein S8